MAEVAQEQTKDALDLSSLSDLFPVEEPAKQDTSKAPSASDDDLETGDDKEPPSPGGDEDEDHEGGLKAQIAGLTKELTRVRRDRTSSTREVDTLRERLAQVQGMLEGLTQGQRQDNTLGKFSDDDLIQGQSEWEDALSEARETGRHARTTNDGVLAQKAEQTASTAKRTLQAIRKELLERTRKVGAEQVRAQSESNEIMADVRALYNTAHENYPDLVDKDSALWQAGKDEYDTHAKLMGALGPLGELVAVSMAVAKDPSLIKGREKQAARKELLQELDNKTEKTLFKQAGKAHVKSAPDFSKLAPNEFNMMIEKLKLGLG